LKGDPQIAVITPYCQELDDVLRTCLESVARQTYPYSRHFLVADGFPNPLVAGWDARHIVLPNAHGDNGNLARAIGAMAAISEGYDGIAFLDADNWFREDHVARLAALHKDTGAAVCTSGRSIHRLDGTLMYVDQSDSDGQSFVDTSCLCIFRAAFDLVPLWVMMPRALNPIGDQVMWQAVLERGVSRAHTIEPTLAFRTQYAVHYKNIRENPPPRAKELEDLRPAKLRYRNMNQTERVALLRGIMEDDALAAGYQMGNGPTRTVTLQSGARRLELEVPHDDGTDGVLREIFERGCYGPVEGLPQPRAILDIGANVGLSAGYLRVVYPTAALYCVEPNPIAYGFLVKNAQAIGNCQTYRAGLHNATHSAKLGFEAGAANTLGSSPRYSARTLLLDARQFVSGLSVQAFDLVKINAGGCEIPIMLSLQQYLETVTVIHVRFQGESDRRLIDQLLALTHVFWRGTVGSSRHSTLTYVNRARLIPHSPLS
jgi:FkbM family methyltransferase